MIVLKAFCIVAKLKLGGTATHSHTSSSENGCSHGRPASLVSSRSSWQRALDVGVAFFYKCFAASHRVPSLPSHGALSRHTRRESCMLGPPLGDNRRSWCSEGSSPTIGWVTVRVEQPSTGLRAIMQHVHAPLRMVGSRNGRGPFLKLDCVATHGTSAQTRVGARQDFIRSVLRDSRDDLEVLDLRSTQSTTNTGACPTNMEQQRHRVLLSANATELTKIFQVFVKTLQGKSIAINNVTGLTSVEDLKFNVKEKTEMRGV